MVSASGSTDASVVSKICSSLIYVFITYLFSADDLINISFLGDIESMPFIEALRQLSFSVGKATAHAYSQRNMLVLIFFSEKF